MRLKLSDITLVQNDHYGNDGHFFVSVFPDAKTWNPLIPELIQKCDN